MINYICVLIVWCAVTLTVVHSYQVQMNHIQYRRNLCKQFDQIKQSFDDTHKKQTELLNKAKIFIDQKASTISNYESNNEDDFAYISKKTTETISILSENNSESALIVELNKNTVNDYTSWEGKFKSNLNSVALCYNKLKDHVEHWKDMKKQLVNDSTMNTEANTLSDLIKSTLSPNEICFFNAQEHNLIQSTTQGETFITTASKTFPIYEKLLGPSTLCEDDPINQLKNLQKEEKVELQKLDSKVTASSKMYYANLAEKIQTVLKKYDPTKIDEIIITQKSNKQVINEMKVRSICKSRKNEINRLLSLVNEAHSDLDGFVSEPILKSLMEHRDSLKSLVSKNDEMLVEKQYIEKSKDDLTERISKLSTNSVKIINYFDIAKTILGSKVGVVNEFLSKPVDLSNIELVISKEGTTSRDLDGFDDEINTRYKIKVSNVVAEHKIITDALKELTTKVENLAIKASNFHENYTTITKKVDLFLKNEVPSAIQETNSKYLAKNIHLVDPTSFVDTTLKTLTDTTAKTVGEESKLDVEVEKFGNMETKLNDLVQKLSNKDTEYNEWMKSGESFKSKLINAMVLTSSALIQTNYLTLSNKLEHSKTLISSTKALTLNIKNEISENNMRKEQLIENANNIRSEYEKSVSAKSELEKSITVYPKQFVDMVNEKIKTLILNMNPQQLVIESTQIVDNMSGLNDKILENLKRIQQIQIGVSQHSTNVDNFETLVTEKINDVTSKNQKLMETVERAEQMTQSVNDLIVKTNEKQKSVSDVAKQIDESIKKIITNGGIQYESHTASVAKSKQHAEMTYNVAKNFYSNKYGINLNEFDGQFSQLSEEYNNLMTNLKELNNQFSTNAANVNRHLDNFKEKGVNYSAEEVQNLNNYHSSLKDDMSNLMFETDSKDYTSFLNACDSKISAYNVHTNRHKEYTANMDKLAEQISKLTLENTNFDLMKPLTKIYNDSNNLATTFKRELKKRYTEMNKINFEDTGVQEFLDSLEQKSIAVNEMQLNSAEKPENLRQLSQEINDECKKFSDLKQQYVKIDVDSVVAKMEPTIASSVEKLKTFKTDIEDKVKLLEEDFTQSTNIIETFKKNKKNSAELNKEIKKQRESYDNTVKEILKLADNNSLSETELNSMHNKYEEEKSELIEDMKSKSLKLKELYNSIKIASDSHTLLLSKLKSITSVLAGTKENTLGLLNTVKTKNNEINDHLTKITAVIEKIQSLLPSLKTLDNNMNEFLLNYSNQLDVFNTKTTEIISNSIKKLISENAKIDSLKTGFESNVAGFTQLYGISNEEQNDQIKSILSGILDAMEAVKNHCSKNIIIAEEEKEKLMKKFEDLLSTSSTNSVKLLNQISETQSKLTCCNLELNGGECKSTTSDECIAFVNGYNLEKLESSLQNLKENLSSTLEGEKLVDESTFGIEELKVLNEKIPIDGEASLEMVFKKYYKEKKAATLKLLMSQVDNYLQSEDKTQAIITELNNKNNIMTENLDRLRNESEKGKQTLVSSKELLSGFSEKSAPLVNNLQETSKNLFIIQSLSIDPTLTNTVNACNQNLENNEKFHAQLDKTLDSLSTGKEETWNNAKNNIASYNDLQNQIVSSRSMLDNFINESTIIEKHEVDLKSEEIQKQLSLNFNELKVVVARIDRMKQTVGEMSSKISDESTQTHSSMEKLTKKLEENSKNINIMDEKLTKLFKTSSIINKLMHNFGELKNRITNLIQLLTESHQKAQDQIIVEKGNVLEASKSASEKLKTNKGNIDNEFELFFKQYKYLKSRANEAQFETPREIDLQYSKNLNLRNKIEEKYINNKNSIDENRYASDAHYLFKQESINRDFASLLKESQNHISAITVSLEKLPELKSKDILAETLAEQQSVYDPINKFVTDKEKFVFNVELYSGNIEQNMNIVLPAFYDRMKEHLSFIDTILQPIEKLLTSNKKNTPKKVSNAEVLVDEEAGIGELEGYARLDDEAQIARIQNFPKKSQLTSIVVASAVIMLTVFLGISILMAKKKTKVKSVINKSRNV